MSVLFCVFILYLVLCELIKCFSLSDSTVIRYASYSISLLVLVCVCSPFLGFLADFPERLKNGEAYGYEEITMSVSSLNDMVLDEFDVILREDVCEVSEIKFGISIDPRCVTLDYDKSDIECVRILLISLDLRECTYVNNVFELQEYISEVYMCKCEVKV